MLLSFFPIKETEKLSSEVDFIHFLSTWQIQVEICVCVYTHNFCVHTHNFCVHLTGVDLNNLKEKKNKAYIIYQSMTCKTVFFKSFCSFWRNLKFDLQVRWLASCQTSYLLQLEHQGLLFPLSPKYTEDTVCNSLWTSTVLRTEMYLLTSQKESEVLTSYREKQ